MTIFRPLGIAAGLLLLAVPSFGYVGPDAQDTFDEGVEALRRGRTEEALAAFQQVLAMDLSNEEAYELWFRGALPLASPARGAARGASARQVARVACFLDLCAPSYPFFGVTLPLRVLGTSAGCA